MLPNLDQSRALYVTDLEHCEPQTSLDRETRPGHWRTLSYKTDTLAGTMLMAGELTGAPEVRFPLNMTGWYAISIGMYYRHGFDAVAEVRLTSDPSFTLMSLYAGADAPAPPGTGRWSANIMELFWKIADITHQDLHLRQLCTQARLPDGSGENRYAKAGIAYIKLVPLTPEEVRAQQVDRQRNDTKRLYAHNDASSFECTYHVSTPQDIYREIEPYRNTDFSRLYWEVAYGDMLLYPGKTGRLPTFDGLEDFQLAFERNCVQTWRTFRANGIDQLKLAADFTHEMGLELHASFRPAGFYHTPFAENTWNYGSVYFQHPELRATARDGSLSPRLSYAYPETRRFALAVLREVAQYPIDGICLLYVRRPPYVEYDPPLVEGFKAEVGADPRQLDDNDPRWLAYRCRVLTQFMREVRQEMDTVAREQGRTKRIPVSAILSARQEENLYYGMDVKAWIAEGLVDTIIPYTMAPRLDSSKESWPDIQALHDWVALTRGTSCELAPSILPRNLSPEAYRRKAADIYAAGAEKLFFWDTNSRHTYTAPWDALRGLGHRQEIAAWRRSGDSSLGIPTYQILRELGGWNMAYDTPG